MRIPACQLTAPQSQVVLVSSSDLYTFVTQTLVTPLLD